MSESGKYRYVVAGAGRQGRAAALDLALHGEAGGILVADADPERAEETASAVNRIAGRDVARAEAGDGSEATCLANWLKGADACLSALPYRFNPAVAGACLESGCHFADLGGDPETVSEVLAMNAEAVKAGLSLVPDTGLAPGLANILTARALELASAARGGDPDEGWVVRVRCGGLPVKPEGPLDYALVFSPWGLMKEYDGEVPIVREGKRMTAPALSGLEEIVFDEPPGRCEAFHTVGGASTMPESFAGRLREFDYKTVRYPGHQAKVLLLSEIGLLSEQPLEAGGGGPAVAPRSLLYSLMEQRLPTGVPDLVVLGVEVHGEGLESPARLLVHEFGDEETGLSAMERCTGFPAAAIVHAQASGDVKPGALPPERAVDASEHIEAVRRRGIKVGEYP